MTSKNRARYDFMKTIRALDYLNALVLLGFCFFCFAYVDIILSGYYSLAGLKGHILDWYDFNNNVTNNYLPSTYAVLALWQAIPFKFFGYNPLGPVANGMILWLKAGTLLFAVFSGVVIRNIAQELGCGKRDSLLVSLFWFLTPFAVFSLLIFSQMDIFTLFFMMLGVLYLLKRDGLRFALFFGISITFKYFPALAFVPLLLLFEKNILKIAGYMAVFAAPAAIEVFLYRNSYMFKEVFFWGASAGGKLFIAMVSGTLIHIYPFIWVTTVGLAYWLNLKDRKDEFNYWVLYIPLLVFTPMFMLIRWYPQWLMILTPFLAITTLYQRRKIGFFTLVEYVCYYCYISYVVIYFCSQVDAAMFLQGGAEAFGLVGLNNHVMKEFYIFRDRRSWAFTGIAATIFVQLLFKFPLHHFLPQLGGDIRLKMDQFDVNHLRIRLFVSVMMFALPAVLCLSRPYPALVLAALLIFPIAQLSLILLRENGPGSTSSRITKPV